MTVKDLLPWRNHWVLKKPDREASADPFVSLRQEINRLFDDFWGEGAPSPWGDMEGQSPRVDVSETEKEVVVSAELPGIDEKDVQVTLDRSALVISGEKKAEHETKDRHFHRIERSYGAFRRVVPLPAEVDESKTEAVFKNGVLKVSLTKTAENTRGRKKIAVHSG